jgi:hypothetical protein
MTRLEERDMIWTPESQAHLAPPRNDKVAGELEALWNVVHAHADRIARLTQRIQMLEDKNGHHD